MSYLLAGGCSYTNPNYIQVAYSDEEMESMGHGSVGSGPWKMWPEYLGEKLNLKNINTGENGASNDLIYHNVLHKAIDKKPKVIAVLWSDIDRTNTFQKPWYPPTYFTVLINAYLILSKYDFKEDENIFGLDHCNFSDTFKYIKLRYPDKIDEIFKYYEGHPILNVANKIGNDKLNHSDYLWILENENYNPEQTITFLLSPIYNLILYCIQNNIKLVMAGALCWKFHCKEIPYLNGLKTRVDPSEREKFYYDHILPEYAKKLDKFRNYWKNISNSLIDHNLFHMIEESFRHPLVSCYGWPFNKMYGGVNSHDFDNFSVIGSEDTHPSPDGQRVIADIMYKAYEELK